MPNTTLSPVPLAVIALVIGVALAGCGGSSPTTTTSASASTALASTGRTATTTTVRRHTNPHPYGSGRLGFARCMRANGVGTFSDSGAAVHLDPSAPGFRTAVAKCSKLVPGGMVPAVPGSNTHPSPRTLDKLVRIAKCMRAHGVPQFPDPRTSVPANPMQDGIQEVTDYDGAILLFPASLNLQAPAYRQALTDCGSPPLGLPH
jgi:hypothetical protein